MEKITVTITYHFIRKNLKDIGIKVESNHGVLSTPHSKCKHNRDKNNQKQNRINVKFIIGIKVESNHGVLSTPHWKHKHNSEKNKQKQNKYNLCIIQ